MPVKELQGRASATAPASKHECLELLAAVERYPSWYPEVIRSVERLDPAEGDGPPRVGASLHFSYGPISHDLELQLEVVIDPASGVWLNRVPYDPGDRERFTVHWRLDERPGDTRTDIDLRLEANLDIPRFVPVPVGTIGDSFASRFLTAAVTALS